MLNECHMIGRLSSAAEERTFPSGDSVVLFRLVVPRPQPGRVDTFDCRVELASLRKRVLKYQPGDELDVSGSLHRRFWKTSAGVASRHELLITSLTKMRTERN